MLYSPVPPQPCSDLGAGAGLAPPTPAPPGIPCLPVDLVEGMEKGISGIRATCLGHFNQPGELLCLRVRWAH